ncbi:hypothetical protein N7471_010481 [Penicillium samsonianum]|uniref:uncharacterized protein n=1 Tax=Penicillium samsonianum TaxID=1882272 RepID=UPI0025494549|nr:uncharacterized protein N7471_010481 [Penicillium samsonianum]KAJ6125988.1 hypothetical protein N7471_010481 [Penicillium samsonianum]
MMRCFSHLFAKKPSPDPSQSSGNIGEPGEALFNRCQEFSSENDAQIVLKPPVKVATEEGKNDFCNIVAEECSKQFIGGQLPTIARDIFAGKGAFQALGNYPEEFLQSDNAEITGEWPPPYSNQLSTQTESSAGKDGGTLRQPR